MVNPVLCISDRTTPMAFEAEIYGTKEEGVGYAAVCLPEGQYNWTFEQERKKLLD